jgi:hypothetical protein
MIKILVGLIAATALTLSVACGGKAESPSEDPTPTMFCPTDMVLAQQSIDANGNYQPGNCHVVRPVAAIITAPSFTESTGCDKTAYEARQCIPGQTGQKYNVTVLEDSNRQLHFTWGEVSEGAYRAKVETSFQYLAANGYSVEAVCNTYRSLTADELAHTVSSDDPATRERAVEILFEVCEDA